MRPPPPLISTAHPAAAHRIPLIRRAKSVIHRRSRRRSRSIVIGFSSRISYTSSHLDRHFLFLLFLSFSLFSLFFSIVCNPQWVFLGWGGGSQPPSIPTYNGALVPYSFFLLLPLLLPLLLSGSLWLCCVTLVSEETSAMSDDRV